MSNIVILERFLDYCSVKNRTISKNIANAATDNYKSEDVSFDNILNQNMKSMLKSTSSKHFSVIGSEKSGPIVKKLRDESGFMVSENGNNVDMEREMAELARNTLNYKFATKKISGYYKSLQGVIRGGGGVG